MAVDKAFEEVLEFVWSLREAGSNSIKALLEIDEVKEAEADSSTLEAMQRDGLLTLDNDSITLTNKGEKLAEAAIRRHRLAERLLTEVLAMDTDSVEKNACSFEHTLSPEVTDRICALLGHPPTCPHGLPVPRGECCKKSKDAVKPIVEPLTELGVGDSGRIIFILSGSHARLDKLSALGIVPGSVLHVHQKRPAFVLQLGETSLAFDADIVKEIYVKKMS
ncbi:MAG: metal-dependent transcriptional regulator [Deltaproteobacteria bacterium]|nr:metal-dependent transcriptional regulator [Deltaproteobacteria bacterium]